MVSTRVPSHIKRSLPQRFIRGVEKKLNQSKSSYQGKFFHLSDGDTEQHYM